MSQHTDNTKVRITDGWERIGHWTLAASCLFCVISGLGLMFHHWSIIPTILGGYYATKWLHIFSGVIFALTLLWAYWKWNRDCKFEKDDLGWIMQAGGYLWEAKNLPPVYKYNAGQKAFFWCLVGCGILIIVTGLIMLNPMILGYDIGALAFMLHAGSVFILASFIMVHIYLGTIGNPGTVQAMLTGWVSKAWANTHCPRWLEEYERKFTIK
jgi:formate dehydrogenase subunit gamma